MEVYSPMNSEPIRDPLSTRWVGVTFVNPVSGEEIEVLDVDPETEQLRGRLTVEPGGIGPPAHVHPHQVETFEVESGDLTVQIGEETLVLSDDESISIPPETSHGFENRSDAPVSFLGAIHPGSKLLHALSTLSGLAQDGKLTEDGTPHFLQAMVFAEEMKNSMYLASPPYRIQQALWTIFAPIGRALGYRATYDQYLDPGYWAEVANAR